ncbi:heat shock cognate 71 kDa protein-like [Oscarella lobularis]|uniref:heat shock cognate 71 kDa protein-like n=1 Tax=Oscarella lobularis TaxID=121494 RepID=UPI0033130FBC
MAASASSDWRNYYTTKQLTKGKSIRQYLGLMIDCIRGPPNDARGTCEEPEMEEEERGANLEGDPFEKPSDETRTLKNEAEKPKETSEAVETPSPAVGIDLGTTYSCIAVWEGGRATVIANNMGHRTTPSWVAYTESDMLVGEAAASQASRNPKNTIYDAKRMIGRRRSDDVIEEFLSLWSFDLAESEHCAVKVKKRGVETIVTPEEISAAVLMKMKRTAEDYLGSPIKSVVVTVPAYFNDAQRQATIDACTIAGLKLERVINEPTAASLAYGLERGTGSDEPRTLLIYDLGGGTLDVTVLIVDGHVFEVKSTSGDMQLGGQDFDNNLVKYFAPQVKEKCGNVNVLENAKALKKLRDACQQLKHTLSHSTEGSIEVDALIGGEDFDASLTRDQFNDINSDLFERCLVPVERALKDAGVSKGDVDEIVLIGGSSRIPQIQALLENFFPEKTLSKRINPDEAVAMGAAIQAANLTLTYEEKLAFEKLGGLTLMDVTPMSLGIELAGGKMSVLIPRNTTIPYSHSRIYYNNEDNQTKAIVEVFEGEDKFTKKNRLLGKFILPGLPPRPRGQVKISVMFSVDENGVLEVSASVSEENGATAKLVIEKEKGLMGEDELAQKAKEAREWENESKRKRLN